MVYGVGKGDRFVISLQNMLYDRPRPGIGLTSIKLVFPGIHLWLGNLPCK